MENNLTDSAFFIEENTNFYNSFFKSIKNEVNFEYGAIFYKEANSEILVFEFNKNKKTYSQIKFPIKVQNLEIGYFIFSRKTPFLENEKENLEKKCALFSEKIKDFELSKIFKKQLFILQNAILEKTNTTKKLTQKNKELVEIDKVRNKFLTYITHELRTPLHLIMGLSTALRDEMLGSLNEKQKTYSNKILSLSIQLTGLINDLLDISKLEAGQMQLNISKYNPVDIIKEVITTVEPLLLEKNIKIETNFKFKDNLNLDYIKFRQIIYNLLGNAIKFSFENSIIKISTSKKENIATITVQDYGIGIDKALTDKIFDKFVQIENKYTNSYSSSGLGLTITKEFVKLQNGKIKVKSKLNKGSTFILEFKI